MDKIIIKESVINDVHEDGHQSVTVDGVVVWEGQVGETVPDDVIAALVREEEENERKEFYAAQEQSRAGRDQLHATRVRPPTVEE
jgi:hypothetical protein